MRNVQKNHSPEFKAKVVLELLKEEKTLAQLAYEYGVSAGQISRWRQQALENLPQLFSKSNELAKSQAEYESKIDELYTEIGKLSGPFRKFVSDSNCSQLSF